MPKPPSPLDHLDESLRTRIRKGRAVRDALLAQHRAPEWLLGRPKDTQLGEASPTFVYLAQALTSPLGVGPEHVPELVARVWEGHGADARYTLEVPRFLLAVDCMVRVLAPVALDHFKRAAPAARLRAAPAPRDHETFYALHEAVEAAAREIGDARAFEAQARSLDDALRVRTVGFGIVAIRHAQTVIEADFEPQVSVPEMRGLYLRVLPVLAGARSVPGRAAEVDRALLDLLRDVVAVTDGAFAPELARLDSVWARLRKLS